MAITVKENNIVAVSMGVQGIQGPQGIQGNPGNMSGFTNANGFTGTVTNGSLAIDQQTANTTQSGKLSSTDWALFNDKGTSNLTLGSTSTTAFRGDYGTGATSNITTLQGNISSLTATDTAINATLNSHIGNYTNPHNVTKSQIGLSNVDNTADLAKPISNATQSALDAKLTGFTDLNGFTGTRTNNNLSLVLQNANSTQSGQLTSADWTTFNNKGTSNLTLGTNSTTAFAGDLGAGAVSNISTLQTDVAALNSAMRYIGGWDASTGVFPGGGTAQSGYVYSVAVAGTVDGVSFAITDRINAIIDNASTSTYSGNWLKEDYTDQVTSVNGQVGSVNLTTANVSASTDKNYVTDAKLSVLNVTTGTNTGDQDLSGYVPTARTINGQNLTVNITLAHSGNSGLGWTASGHTGGNTVLAGFNATGAASEYSLSGNGSLIVTSNNAVLGTPASGTLTNCNGTATGLTAGNVTNGVIAIANGGTGQSTRQTAINALAGNTTNALYLRGDGNNITMTAIQASDLPMACILHVRDEKTNGTNAGDASTGVNTRTLNTSVTNTITSASLSSNQITLPAGTYKILFRSPFMGTVANNRAYLYNTTDSSVSILGSSEYGNTGGVAIYSGNSHGIGVLTISGSKVFELRHYFLSATSTGYGLGGTSSSGVGNDVYAEVFIEKIA